MKITMWRHDPSSVKPMLSKAGRLWFDPLTMALTAVPSLLGVWLVLRTKSVLIPVVLHNFGNAILLLI